MRGKEGEIDKGAKKADRMKAIQRDVGKKKKTKRDKFCVRRNELEEEREMRMRK